MRVHIIAAALLGTAASAQFTASASASWRVFFDWSKPDITRDAEATLDELATVYIQTRPSRVVIIGHSDRSGPAGVNWRASRRRAEAVRDQLTARGVPREIMTIESRGEAMPIVPTEDGVREAQNRRVEITFR